MKKIISIIICAIIAISGYSQGNLYKTNIYVSNSLTSKKIIVNDTITCDSLKVCNNDTCVWLSPYTLSRLGRIFYAKNAITLDGDTFKLGNSLSDTTFIGSPGEYTYPLFINSAEWAWDSPWGILQRDSSGLHVGFTTPHGIYYNGDYDSWFDSHPDGLPPVRWIRNEIGSSVNAGGGLTKTNDTIKLGGQADTTNLVIRPKKDGRIIIGDALQGFEDGEYGVAIYNRGDTAIESEISAGDSIKSSVIGSYLDRNNMQINTKGGKNHNVYQDSISLKYDPTYLDSLLFNYYSIPYLGLVQSIAESYATDTTNMSLRLDSMLKKIDTTTRYKVLTRTPADSLYLAKKDTIDISALYYSKVELNTPLAGGIVDYQNINNAPNYTDTLHNLLETEGLSDINWNNITINKPTTIDTLEHHTVSATIDLRATGNTLLSGTHTGQGIILNSVKLLVEGDFDNTGNTTPPSISIGTNATAYNNILVTDTLKNGAAYKLYKYQLDDYMYSLNSSQLHFKINQATDANVFRVRILCDYNLINTSAVYEYLAETTTFTNRWTTPPTTEQKQGIDSLIRYLKDSAVWDLGYACYLFNLNEEASSVNNLISDNYNLTKTGTTVYTAGEYVDFSNTSTYYSTGLVPNSVYTISDFSVGFWISAAVVNNAFLLGCQTASTSTRLFLSYNSGGTDQLNLNSSTALANDWVSLSKFCLASYNGTNYYTYNDGVQNFSAAYTAGSLSTQEIIINGYNNNGTKPASPSRATTKMIWIGKYSTATQARGLSNIMKWWDARAKVLF